MDRMREKFSKFSHMVMKEADDKKKEIIREAEKDKEAALEAGEIDFLKKAYEKIQSAVRKIEKETNEEVSKAILESKQALFNRREEIINSVFEGVRAKLIEFRTSQDYRISMKKQAQQALSPFGSEELQVLVDNEDMDLFREILTELGIKAEIAESDEQLLGGFLVMNRTRGIMYDFSYISRLNEEKATFLEKYGISID